ncbi:MAG: septal ring lytic transglycosylase RlpA family protein [Hyphomonadaceae bacterium]
MRRAPKALLISCIGLAVFAGEAAAQRAPITYAGQGGASTAAVTETASLGAGLSGGGENSYGYGSSAQRRQGAAIDLRRPNARRSAPVVFEPPAPDADAEDAQAPAVTQTASATQEQGAQPWLERERVGPPYEANGRWYVPTPEPGYEQTGVASWYGPQFHGQRTANGEIYDQEALTAAHPTLPLNSLVQVTNLENGREVIVRITDRGPFVGERLIDLSHGAATVLGFEQAGRTRVHVRYLGPAPRRVNADGSTPAPARAPSPAPTRQAQEGPVSLLPPAVETAALEAPPPPQAPAYTQASYQPAAAVGGYFVQVGAFSDPSNARRVADAVAAAGPVVMDVRQTASGAELFRVRVGPWASGQEAEAARRTLAGMGYGDSVVAAR